MNSSAQRFRPNALRPRVPATPCGKEYCSASLLHRRPHKIARSTILPDLPTTPTKDELTIHRHPSRPRAGDLANARDQ